MHTIFTLGFLCVIYCVTSKNALRWEEKFFRTQEGMR